MSSFIKFTDAVVCDIDDWIPSNDGYNPHNVRPWLISDHASSHCRVLAVCFASNEQDAFDIAVDNDKLDAFKCNCDNEEECECHPLGNASEMFNMENMNIIELPNVPMSFESLFFSVHDRKGN